MCSAIWFKHYKKENIKRYKFSIIHTHFICCMVQIQHIYKCFATPAYIYIYVYVCMNAYINMSTSLNLTCFALDYPISSCRMAFLWKLWSCPIGQLWWAIESKAIINIFVLLVKKTTNNTLKLEGQGITRKGNTFQLPCNFGNSPWWSW